MDSLEICFCVMALIYCDTFTILQLQTVHNYILPYFLVIPFVVVIVVVVVVVMVMVIILFVVCFVG